MSSAFKGSRQWRLSIMENGYSDGNARGIHEKEHSQLVKNMTGTRIRISPISIEHKVANDCANERNCPCQYKPHVEKMSQQIHNAEIDHCTDCTDCGKFQKPNAFLAFSQNH